MLLPGSAGPSRPQKREKISEKQFSCEGQLPRKLGTRTKRNHSAGTGYRCRGAVVVPSARCLLALSGGERFRHQRTQDSPRRTHLVERCASLLRLVRRAAAHRGRVGVRGARWAEAKAVPVGRRATPARPTPLQYLAGSVSSHRYRRGRFYGHLSRGGLSCKWLRPIFQHWEYLGVVPRLVWDSDTRGGAGQSQGAGAWRGTSDEGGVIPVPRLLLQSLPGRRAKCEYTGQLRLEP